MPNCPLCNTPGAYVGFSSVECRNPDCAHYDPKLEYLCPCCGIAGHRPEYEAVEATAADNYDPSIPAFSAGNGYNGAAFNAEPASYNADPSGYSAEPSQYNPDGSPTSSAPQGDASGYLGTPGPNSPA